MVELTDQSRLPAAEPPLRRPISEELLNELARRIAVRYPDACVVLFGSQARGDARPGSDVDLLVLVDTPKHPLAVASELHGLTWGRNFGLDLLVMTPQRVRERRARFDPFIEYIFREGRVLRGSLDFLCKASDFSCKSSASHAANGEKGSES